MFERTNNKKITISREETTSALAGFHAGLYPGEFSWADARKTASVEVGILHDQKYRNVV